MNKTIFITGASSGIGRATAIYFADKGWKVAASMRSLENASYFKPFKNITCYTLDVTSKIEISECVEKVMLDFGKIDVLLNNAGYGAVGAFEKSTDLEIKNQFEVNVFGLMSLSRAFIPIFRKQQEGIIINITSVGGRMTFPLYSIYNSSKWAVEGFAEALQYELKPFNIKVKNIQPGPIRTDFYSRSQNLFENNEIQVYDGLEKKVLGKFKKLGENGAPPELVAKTIFKAATDAGAKLRYPVGAQAGLILAFRKILPSRLYNAIVRKAMS